MRSTRILTVILALGLAAAPAAAQTPDAACAADSLYLISPDQVDLRLQEGGRLGMVIRWPTLDINEATCYSLDGIDDLGFTPEVTGGFGDQVDRVLRFTTSDSGFVGADQPQRLWLNWRSVGAETYGTLAGVINLANNGGVLRWDASEGRWVQLNAGLPMHWRQTNVVALAESQGVMYAGITGGQVVETEPKGLYRHDGVAWARLAPEIFDSARRITRIAVDPANPDRVAVGTALTGLWVSGDGGATFTQWTSGLDPGFDPLPGSYPVKGLAWGGGRLFVAVDNLGMFVSTDAGASFARLDLWVPKDLAAADPEPELPKVNQILIDPASPDRVLVALQFHGVYESDDGGVNWHDLYGDLVVPGDPSGIEWSSYSALAVAVDPGDPDVILMGVQRLGLYRTTDGGATWERQVGGALQPTNTGQLTRFAIVAMPGDPGHFVVHEDRWAILESFDGGATWSRFAVEPTLKTGLNLRPSASGAGDLLLGTWGGGIYEPGTPLRMAKTYSAGTSTALRSLELGLEISFGEGPVARDDEFELVCQTFQGWAVWRAPGADREDMELIGLYDRVNPETCIEGYCGDLNFEPIPQCFAAKRAACFAGVGTDTVQFFDAEVYNGFNYYYAVSSFDYGNTALTTPQNNNRTMLFSPRWAGDETSPFAGDGNRTFVQVNFAAEPAAKGEEIYVYPNPLRLGEGISTPDDPTVVWTNLPPGSRIRVFTTAGDDVADLGPDNQSGGQIRWLTRNRDREPVAPGVYLYKVTMPEREEYWGRLVIIR